MPETYWVDKTIIGVVPNTTLTSYVEWTYADEPQVAIEQNLLGPFESELVALKTANILLHSKLDLVQHQLNLCRDIFKHGLHVVDTVIVSE